MIEIHLDTPLITVDHYKKERYYTIFDDNVAICSFYITEGNLPANSCLCFTNLRESSSYITFYENYFEVLHNKLTTLQYTEEDIKEAFSILGIVVREYNSLFGN